MSLGRNEFTLGVEKYCEIITRCCARRKARVRKCLCTHPRSGCENYVPRSEELKRKLRHAQVMLGFPRQAVTRRTTKMIASTCPSVFRFHSSALNSVRSLVGPHVSSVLLSTGNQVLCQCIFFWGDATLFLGSHPGMSYSSMFSPASPSANIDFRYSSFQRYVSRK